MDDERGGAWRRREKGEGKREKGEGRIPGI